VELQRRKKTVMGRDCAKVLQEREKTHSGKTRDEPRHGGESARGPKERGKNKSFTVQLQSRKKSR